MDLRRFRELRGFSQNKLSSISGVSQSHIGKYERGITSPGADIIRALCDALGFTADELLGRETKAGWIVVV